VWAGSVVGGKCFKTPTQWTRSTRSAQGTAVDGENCRQVWKLHCRRPQLPARPGCHNATFGRKLHPLLSYHVVARLRTVKTAVD
jgi:hypothetical protein